MLIYYFLWQSFSIIAFLLISLPFVSPPLFFSIFLSLLILSRTHPHSQHTTHIHNRFAPALSKMPCWSISNRFGPRRRPHDAHSAGVGGVGAGVGGEDREDQKGQRVSCHQQSSLTVTYCEFASDSACSVLSLSMGTLFYFFSVLIFNFHTQTLTRVGRRRGRGLLACNDRRPSSFIKYAK